MYINEWSVLMYTEEGFKRVVDMFINFYYFLEMTGNFTILMYTSIGINVP